MVPALDATFSENGSTAPHARTADAVASRSHGPRRASIRPIPIASGHCAAIAVTCRYPPQPAAIRRSLPQTCRDPPQPASIRRSLPQSVAVCRNPSRSAAIRRSLPQSVAVCRNPSRSAAIRRHLPQSGAVCHNPPPCDGTDPTGLPRIAEARVPERRAGVSRRSNFDGLTPRGPLARTRFVASLHTTLSKG